MQEQNHHKHNHNSLTQQIQQLHQFETSPNTAFQSYSNFHQNFNQNNNQNLQNLNIASSSNNINSNVVTQFPSDKQLITKIQSTYLSTSNQIIKNAEAFLIECSKNPQFINKMLLFLSPSSTSTSSSQFDQKFKQSASIMLKKVIYNIAQMSDQQVNKSFFIREFYILLKSQNVSTKVKQQLAVCTQYILNKDQDNKYKKQFLQRIYQDQQDILNSKNKQMQEYTSLNNNTNNVQNKVLSNFTNAAKLNQKQLEQLHGLMYMNISFLNSLVQIQDISQFFIRICSLLCQLSFYLLSNLLQQSLLIQNDRLNGKIQNISSNSLKRASLIIQCQKMLFEFIQLCIQRIFDQCEAIPDQIKFIRNNFQLVSTFHLHLINFKHYQDFSKIEQKVRASSNNNMENLKVHHNQQIYNEKELSQSIIYSGNQFIHTKFTRQIKQRIIQCIFQIYSASPIPQNLFLVIYRTFICQSVILDKDRQQQQQKILSRCLEILENQLVQKFQPYYKFYISRKYQIMFCLFLYSYTSERELQDMIENPERFSELAQEFTEGYSSSSIIKIRAACFFKSLALNIDQVPKQLLQICIIFISANLPNQTVKSQHIAQIKDKFEHFPFSMIPAISQLDCIFMVLSLMSCIYCKDQQKYRIVCSIISTNYFNFFQIEAGQGNTRNNLLNTLILTRIIRLLGYYPMPPFYSFIQLKMKSNRVCLIQGMKSFQRILKQKQYQQIYILLGQIFLDMLNQIKVNDPLAQSLFLNNYQKIVSINQQLFKKIIKKLIQTFIQNQNSMQGQRNQRQHLAILSLNFLCSLIIKQKDYNKKMYIQQQISKIIQNCQNNPKYQQKIIQIYLSILKQTTVVNQVVFAFAQSKIQKIQTYGNNSLIYKFYNQLFLKLDNSKIKIDYMYSMIFMKLVECAKYCSSWDKNKQQNQINKNIKNIQNLQVISSIVPQLSMLMSQIILSFNDIRISQENLILLFQLAESQTKNNHHQISSSSSSSSKLNELTIQQHSIIPSQYYQKLHNKISILIVILSYIYRAPTFVRQALIKKKLYDQAFKIFFSQEFIGKINRRIFVLAMVKFLQIQSQQQKYFKEIVMICSKYLKQQINYHNNNKIKQKKQSIKKRKRKQDPKLRRLFQLKPDSDADGYADDQRRQSQEQDQVKANSFQEQIQIQPIKSTNLKVNHQLNQKVIRIKKQQTFFWDNFYRNFKHPINHLSQFDQFKQRIWQNVDVINQKFNQKQKQEIRQLMGIDWWHNKVRRVYTVKKGNYLSNNNNEMAMMNQNSVENLGNLKNMQNIGGLNYTLNQEQE